MNCTRCKKDIYEKSNYIQLKEFDSGEVLHINYMHKECWNGLMDSKQKAMGMLKNILRKRGIETEEVVEV